MPGINGGPSVTSTPNVTAATAPAGSTAVQNVVQQDPVSGLFNAGGAPVASINSLVSGAGIQTLYPMRKWRAAVGKARGGIRNAKLLYLGDSTGVGAGSTGSPGFNPGGKVKALPVLLASMLNSTFMPTNAHAWFGTGGVGATNADFTNWDPRFVMGGNWDRNYAGANGLGGSYMRNLSTVGTLTFTPSAAGASSANVDTFVIWYVVASIAGAFNYSVDAGATTPVNCNNATSSVQSVTVAAGAVGAHTLNITPTTANVWILGIEAFDSTTKQIEVIDGSINGCYVNNFLAALDPWSAANEIGTLAPDLTIIQLQINDCNQGTALATYSANLQSLVNICAASGDVIIRSGYPSQITYNANAALANQQAYRDAAKTIAANNGLLFDDLWARTGSYEIQQAVPGGGMYADAQHPTGALYANSALSLASLIRGY